MNPVRAAGGGRKAKLDKHLPVAPLGEQVVVITEPYELIDDCARDIWCKFSQILIKRKTLSVADVPVLVCYCNNQSIYLKAEKRLSVEGYTVPTSSGVKKHPLMNVRNESLSLMIRAGSLLGLDPLSRTKAVTTSSN